MKSIVYFVLTALFAVSSCKKSDVTPAEEEALIEKYIIDNKLVIDKKTSSGLRIIYQCRLVKASKFFIVH